MRNRHRMANVYNAYTHTKSQADSTQAPPSRPSSCRFGIFVIIECATHNVEISVHRTHCGWIYVFVVFSAFFFFHAFFPTTNFGFFSFFFAWNASLVNGLAVIVIVIFRFKITISFTFTFCCLALSMWPMCFKFDDRIKSIQFERSHTGWLTIEFQWNRHIGVNGRFYSQFTVKVCSYSFVVCGVDSDFGLTCSSARCNRLDVAVWVQDS